MYPIGNIMSSFVPSTENANLTTGFAQRGRGDHNKGGRGGGGSRGSRGGRGRGRGGRGGVSIDIYVSRRNKTYVEKI